MPIQNDCLEMRRKLRSYSVAKDEMSSSSNEENKRPKRKAKRDRQDERQTRQDKRQTRRDERHIRRDRQKERQTRQDESQTSQDRRQTRQNRRDERQASQDEGQTRQSERQTRQSERQTRQSERQAGQSERQTGQEERQIGQEERQTGQEERQTGQEERQTGQEERHTGQEERQTRQEEIKTKKTIQSSAKRKTYTPRKIVYKPPERPSSSQDSSSCSEKEQECKKPKASILRRMRGRFLRQLLPEAEMLAQIQKIANDDKILNGPEAFNNINRNKGARKSETLGEIELHVICNSITKAVDDTTLIWLVQIRNIFAHGLPYMDRSYITRIVFDWRHRNLILLEQGSVVAGICFRMFPAQNICEIVFLAVASSKHVKGYGSHLMNHLKDYSLHNNIKYLLTYAAYEACVYFEKQGFYDVTLPESVYKGYINVYDGARLMQCELFRTIKYTDFNETMSRYKKIIHEYLCYEPV